MNMRTSIGSCLLIAGSMVSLAAWGQDVKSTQTEHALAPTQLPTMEVLGTQKINTEYARELTQAETVVHRIGNSPAVKRLAPFELQRAQEQLKWAEQALARESFSGYLEYPIVRRCANGALASARLAEAKAGLTTNS